MPGGSTTGAAAEIAGGTGALARIITALVDAAWAIVPAEHLPHDAPQKIQPFYRWSFNGAPDHPSSVLPDVFPNYTMPAIAKPPEAAKPAAPPPQPSPKPATTCRHANVWSSSSVRS